MSSVIARTAVVATVAVLVLLSAVPTAAGEGTRQQLDESADTIDRTVTAAECRAFSLAWPSGYDCIFGPNDEFTCALRGETQSIRHATDGLRYRLSGEVECREDGRTLRVLHGRFTTTEGVVARRCTNSWCEKRGGVYEVYATNNTFPRCVYEFSAPTVDRRDRAQRLTVQLPGDEAASFRLPEFEIANGDGVGISRSGPDLAAEFWVRDDGDPSNGYSEGVADLNFRLSTPGDRLGIAAVAENCTPTEELAGFTVQGDLQFEINDHSLFGRPSAG